MNYTKQVDKQKNDESFNIFQFMDYLIHESTTFECFNDGNNGIIDLNIFDNDNKNIGVLHDFRRM